MALAPSSPWTAPGRASTTRYLLLAAFAAVLAVLATVLLGILASAMVEHSFVDARFDSRRKPGDEADRASITLAVVPLTGTRHLLAQWGAFAAHLQSGLGHDVVLVRGESYAEVSRSVERGEVHAALLCAEPYIRLRRRGLATLLAVPRVRGRSLTRSLVLARTDAPVHSFDDLRGRRVGLSEPSSDTGSLYPTWLLRKKGTTPSDFFGRVVWTGSHERSVLAVAAGALDAAAVDEVAYDDLKRHDATLATRLKVVHVSPAFGIAPFVVSSKLAPDLVRALRRAFLSAHAHPVGRACLDALEIDSFEPGDPAAYESVEVMLDAVER